MPFVRLSIQHVKIMYCVCASVLEIIASPRGLVMWSVRICWHVRDIELPKYLHTKTPINVLLIIISFGVEFPQLQLNDSCPNCQFASLTYTGQCYWYRVLLRPERDQLQNC